MKKRKLGFYRFLFILLSVILFLTILMVQSYYNLQEELKGPSDGWGRSLAINAKTFALRPPAILNNNGSTELLTYNNNNFIKITIDKDTADYKQSELSIDGVEYYKIKDFDWSKDFIFWTENYTLYYSSLDSSGIYNGKTQIMDGVKDFKIVDNGDSCIIAVAANSGIQILEAKAGNVVQLGQEYAVNEIQDINIAEDNASNYHIAVISKPEQYSFNIKYLTFVNNGWNVLSDYTKDDLNSAAIKGLEIGLSKDKAYIFYEVQNLVGSNYISNTFYSTIPLGSSSEMKFSSFLPQNNVRNNVRLLKTQQDVLTGTIILDSYNKRGKMGYAINTFVENEDGSFALKQVSNQESWLGYTDYIKSGDDSEISYLIPGGKGFYSIRYIDNNVNFVTAISKYKPNDMYLSIINTIPGYINALVFALIRSILFLPAILFLGLIEFLEIKKFKKHTNIAIAIALVIYMAIKFATLGTYYTHRALSLMPDIMKFNNAPYVYAIALAAIALLMSVIFKKSKSELNFVVQFLVFMGIDLILTTFLYTTYLV